MIVIAATLCVGCSAELGVAEDNRDDSPDDSTSDAGQPEQPELGAPERPFAPSNIPATALRTSDAALVLNLDHSPAVIDTSALSITAADGGELLAAGMSFETVSQPSGPELAVLSLGSLQIAADVLVEVRGARALALVVDGDAVVDGVIRAVGGDAQAYELAGPGGFAGSANDAENGAGAGGGISGQSDTGGGGGGHLASGGGGGTRNGELGGAGGISVDSPQLIPLVGGSGGGRGGGADGGVGGGGGGAIQISAFGELRIETSGGINAGGGGGRGGRGDDGGGGGGAGGAILLEATSMEIRGVLAANGGGGGAGANVAEPGQSGQPGQLSAEPAAPGQAVGEGTAGGAGGAGGEAAGQPGQAANEAENTDNAGGGGGAGGRIHLRSSEPARIAGTISPELGLSQESLP
ncbi:MAG: hypothetical protein AAGC55_22630 [Myxococcota bacterium]